MYGNTPGKPPVLEVGSWGMVSRRLNPEVAACRATRPPDTVGNMEWRERIVVDSDVLVGKPVVKGTRIAVELVIDLLARGYTNEQVLAQYVHLTAADVHACLAYAAEVLQSEKVYALPR
jgi:uncharacterized protein (DUF433 family)